MYQALYRKWRPKTFSDVVGQEHITDTLKAQVSSGRTAHAYLFTGTRGTGKTSCAKILARAVNCQNPHDGEPCNECAACRGILTESILDVLEIDAATNNGVDNIRAIRDETSYTPASVKKRVYIIDEVHMLSTGAFNALLKTLEEPPEHVLFILATTEVHKLPATILSRCQRFDFRRIALNKIADTLMEISKRERISLMPDGATAVAALGDGSMRDSLSLLERCANSQKNLGKNEINEILGLAGEEYACEFASAVAQHDAAKAISCLDKCYSDGMDITSLFDEVCAFCRDILIIKLNCGNVDDLLNPRYNKQVLSKTAELFSSAGIFNLLDALGECRSKMRQSGDKRLEAELCIISLCAEDVVRNEQSPDGEHCVADIKNTVGKSVQNGSRADALPQNARGKEIKSNDNHIKEQDTQNNNEKDLPPWDEEINRSDTVSEAKPSNADRESCADESKNENKNFDKWEQCLKQLKSTLSPPAYTHLALCRATFDGQTVFIHMEDDMTAMMIDRPAVTEEIRRVLRQAANREIGVKMLESGDVKNDMQNEALDSLLSEARASGINVEIN